jgi:hypothetical protein
MAKTMKSKAVATSSFHLDHLILIEELCKIKIHLSICIHRVFAAPLFDSGEHTL